MRGWQTGGVHWGTALVPGMEGAAKGKVGKEVEGVMKTALLAGQKGLAY